MDINKELMATLDGIEQKLTDFAAKSAEEGKIAGAQSAETKSALEALGTKQRELADEILAIKQRGVQQPDAPKVEGWGAQFIKGAGYEAFIGRQSGKFSMQVKNTLTGSADEALQVAAEEALSNAVARISRLGRRIEALQGRPAPK